MPVARAGGAAVAVGPSLSSCPLLAHSSRFSPGQPKSAEQWQQIGHHMAWCLATDRRTVVASLKKGRIRSERRQSRAGRVR